MNNLIKWTLTLLLLSPTSAYSQFLLSDKKLTGTLGGSEYFVGKQMNKPLVTVHIISGVAKPGVYHIPVNTDLAQLFAFAGGASSQSDLEKVSIRRSNKSYSINFEKVLEKSNELPVLAHGDIITIKKQQNFSKTMQWISLVSGFISIAVSATVLYEFQRKE